MFINIFRVGFKKMGPDSFQWCPATGQGATGTNWSTRNSIWTWGRTSSLWPWQSTATGFPESLWIFLLWRYSRPVWTRSFAACSRWLCFVPGGWTHRGLFQPLPFCDSVIPVFSSPTLYFSLYGKFTLLFFLLLFFPVALFYWVENWKTKANKIWFVTQTILILANNVFLCWLQDKTIWRLWKKH